MEKILKRTTDLLNLLDREMTNPITVAYQEALSELPDELAKYERRKRKTPDSHQLHLMIADLMLLKMDFITEEEYKELSDIEGERMPYSKETETSIVASILYDPEFKKDWMKCLEPQHFNFVVHKDLVKLISSFETRYERPITEDEFIEEVGGFLSEKRNIQRIGERRNLKADKEHYIRTVEKILSRGRAGDFSYPIDKMKEFAQYNSIKSFVLDMVDELQKSGVVDIEKAKRKLEEATVMYRGELESRTLDEVEEKEVEWLWDGKIPMGKLTLLVGDPGGGKSMLSVHFASKITKGRPWADDPEKENPKGSVIMLACEDGLSDTIRVRAGTEKADLKKISVIEGTVEKGQVRQFDITSDLPKLKKEVEKVEDTRLIIIDPLFAYTPKGDYYKDPEMRSLVLAPLAKFAEETEVAILAIMHLNKDQAKKALYRVGGSIAFSGSARAVWFVIRDEKDELGERRYLLCEKMSVGPLPPGMAFSIKEGEKYKPYVRFEGESVKLGVEEMLTGAKPRPIDEAVEFLKKNLKDGPKSSKDLVEMAEDEGISKRTLDRAKKRLPIDSNQVFSDEGQYWVWELKKQK